MEFKEITNNPIKELKSVNVLENDSIVIKKIKEKLNSNRGRSRISLFNGDPCDICYRWDGNGILSPKIPREDQLIWEVFDAAFEVVVKNGGQAIKGKAQIGSKLGSAGLPLNSVEGYIANKVFNIQIGETAFGAGFVIYAVLDWAGICKNENGYIKLKRKFKEKYLSEVLQIR